MSTSDSALQRHRALADPSRNRIYVEILDDGPLEVLELAARVGLHPNSVRSHLTALQDAGLVTSERTTVTGPGRPPLSYRSTGVEQTEMRRYQLLAEILTGLVTRSGAHARSELEQVGEAWGRLLVEPPPPYTTLERDQAIDLLVGLLEERGFTPTHSADGDITCVTMASCPFLELARRHPNVVCPIHLGLMRGALAELRSDLTAIRLEQFVTPSTCMAHLAPHQ